MVTTVVPGVPTVSGEPTPVARLKLKISFVSTILSGKMKTFNNFDLSPGPKVTC